MTQGISKEFLSGLVTKAFDAIDGPDDEIGWSIYNQLVLLHNLCTDLNEYTVSVKEGPKRRRWVSLSEGRVPFK